MSRRIGNLLGFNYRFPQGLSAHHRAAAGRVTGACGDEQRLPGMAAIPSGRPTLLGLLCIFLSKTCLVPILQDQIANGENICSRRDDERERARQLGGRQRAQRFPWTWYLLLKTLGSALHPLNVMDVNDLVILFTLTKLAWCADSSGPGGDFFDLRQPW